MTRTPSSTRHNAIWLLNVAASSNKTTDGLMNLCTDLGFDKEVHDLAVDAFQAIPVAVGSNDNERKLEAAFLLADEWEPGDWITLQPMKRMS